MDLEEAKEFRERCTQCAAVSWGLTDEGKYYCTSCHNVTEYLTDYQVFLPIIEFAPCNK
uniref:TATA-box binding protein associated factor, RNA polymerase I subunit B n=1 Tax=Rhinolophus ferrumequinum TaxID=59479 RepID=A0A671EKF8_RHIFE